MPGMNRVKTWVLIGAMGGLFVLLGEVIFKNNAQGLWLGLAVGLGFNFAMYWFSDKIALATTRSKPVTEADAPQLYGIVRELSTEQKLPLPRIYISEMMQPNAFATGRNPDHAAVSVTRGILQVLDERELRAVLAHELSHVTNRDILIGTIAAGIATAITFVTRMAFWFGGFGGSDDDRGGANPLIALVAFILAPIAAFLIQAAVSRSREFQADESGAYLSHDPEALASALRKIESAARQVPVPATVSPSQAHLFIVNPFRGRQAAANFANLFSTHPPTEKRIERLQEIAQRL